LAAVVSLSIRMEEEESGRAMVFVPSETERLRMWLARVSLGRW
jgi:hypothetical protein